MTVDRTRLRIVAVGNHKTGYQGMVEISGGEPFSWTCPHRHGKTDEARNCARHAIRWALEPSAIDIERIAAAMADPLIGELVAGMLAARGIDLPPARPLK